MSKIKNKMLVLTKNLINKSRACLQARQGSILAYSLMVISIMVFIAASVSAVSIIGKKDASSTTFSAQSFQAADSGVQQAVKTINEVITAGHASSTKISDKFPSCADSDTPDDELFTGAEYKLSFFSNEEGTTLLNCNDAIATIRSIKSIGTYKNTARAVQVAVAASSCNLSFAGVTPISYDGDGIGSYSGGTSICAAKFGSSAFMCSSGNIAEIGLPSEVGWISTFSALASSDDCSNWTSDSGKGMIWCGDLDVCGPVGGKQVVSEDDCSHSHPILCCKC